MISHGDGFVVRHRSGRYLRSDLVHFGQRVSYAEGSYAVVYALVSNPLSAILMATRGPWEHHLQRAEWVMVADQFEVVPGPGCGCCGERWGEMQSDGESVHRCAKHIGRNPCAVEGCKRTRATTQGSYFNNNYLCGEHFRIAAPPGSAERRVYNRIWRMHRKRDGKDALWSRELERRYWRIWYRLVAIARARSAGDIDMDQINKMFGWAE